MRTEVRFTCPLRNGVHARPASMLADVLKKYASSVSIEKESTHAVVDARSVLSVVGLDIKLGDTCVVTANGPDAQAAAKAVQELVDGAWVEADEHPPATTAASNGDVKKLELPYGLRGLNIAAASGTVACGGIGVGTAVLVAGLALPPELLAAKASSANAELSAMRKAIVDVGIDLRRRASGSGKKFEGDLLAAHAGIVEDPALQAEIEKQIHAGSTAPQAVVAAAARFTNHLSGAASAYIRDRAVDVQDVCMQVLDRLIGRNGDGHGGSGAGATEVRLTQDSIVVADVLTANQLMRMNHKLLKGLVLGSVGATSHTVILARSLRVPTLLDARGALAMIKAGDELVLDADGGFVMSVSSPAVKRYYDVHRRTLERRRARMDPVAQLPGRTHDGVRLEVAANASTPPEVAKAVAQGAEGVGLLRTELLFLEREESPSEQEQYEAYAGVVDAAAGRSVIIRTFDIGGDKPAKYMNLPVEENPFLGCRGLRLYPKYPDLINTQLRAIIRASARGPVKIMAPMVAIAPEAKWFRDRVREVQAQLRDEGVAFDEKMPIGVMVEVPSVAFVMDQLCKEVDFVSMGTNDLCQYLMAVDRGNKSVASLCVPRQPAFIRLLVSIVDAARKHGTWIGICGEMAGQRQHLPLMVGLGLDEISVAPGEAAGLKVALSMLDSRRCRETLLAATQCADVAEVEHLLATSVNQADREVKILDPEAIVVGSEATSKEEAIKEAVDALFVAGRTERPRAVEEAVWAREMTYSTGLGFGFAIPHCKTDAVGSPTLAVVKLAQPVEWGSMDGKPVGFVILLSVPSADTTGAHMKVFATLARKLMHEDFRQRLSGAGDKATIERALREELALG